MEYLVPEDHMPTLACDAPLDDLDSLPYPLAAMIKFDGVRTLIRDAKFLGRSLKEHRNPYLQGLFRKPEYNGFDAEGIVGEPNHPNLISITSGAFSRQSDKPRENKFIKVDARLYVFDDFSHKGTFAERHAQATDRVRALLIEDPTRPIKIVPYIVIHNTAELLHFEEGVLADGYEGLILRRLDGTHKNGRSTLGKKNKDGTRNIGAEMTYLRVKRFTEHEGTVISVEEGFKNTNEAKKNELGQTERSTKKEGMVPNGMIASMMVQNLKTGVIEKISSGRMTNLEAKLWFEDQTLIVGQLVKYASFLIGKKDKPRFPTFQCVRSKEDMS